MWCIARNAFLTSLRRTVSQRTAQGICRAWKCRGDWRTLCPPAHGDVHTYKERRREVEQQVWNFGQIWALPLNAFWSSLHLYRLWFAAMSNVVITDYFISRGGVWLFAALHGEAGCVSPVPKRCVQGRVWQTAGSPARSGYWPLAWLSVTSPGCGCLWCTALNCTRRDIGEMCTRLLPNPSVYFTPLFPLI